jgi:hypothetical protein
MSVSATENTRENSIGERGKKPREQCLVFDKPLLILVGVSSDRTIFHRRKLQRDLRLDNEAVKVVCGDYSINLLTPQQKVVFVEFDRQRMRESRFC